jgi:hypothetical protein
MIKESLSFHITLKNRDKYSFEERDKFSQDFIQSLGLKVESGCWSRIDLSSEKISGFIKKTKDLISSGKAEFYGYNTLTQILINGQDSKAEWYEINTRNKIETEWKGNVETCKAYKIPQNIHTAYGGKTYVSEKFKEIVEKHHLTGIDFIWVIDTGKYQARQWYIPIAEKPIGRGLDHPWFDPGTLKGSISFQPKDKIFRTGVWHFRISQIKKNYHFDNKIHEELIKLYKPFDLTVLSIKRYLRKYLPGTDFAFNWHIEDILSKDNTVKRQRDICVNRKAKDILLDYNLIREEDVRPFIILDAVPAGGTGLDNNIDPLPGPYLAGPELQKTKLYLEQKFKTFLKTPKEDRIIKPDEVIKMLGNEKKKRPGDFNKKAGGKELLNIPVSVPEAWKEILSVTNGCELDPEFSMLPMQESLAFTEEKKKYVQSLSDEKDDENYLCIGESIDGDWYNLYLNSGKQNVKRISHEDLSVVNEWEDISSFLYDILSGFYD